MKSSVTIEDAKAVIFAQDVPRAVQRSGVLLFDMECARDFTKEQALEHVLQWMEDCKKRQDRLSRIPSPIQIERLQMLLDGLTPKQIALKHNISRAGVKQNFYRMRKRIRVDTLYQAIAIAARLGWVNVDDLIE